MNSLRQWKRDEIVFTLLPLEMSVCICDCLTKLTWARVCVCACTLCSGYEKYNTIRADSALCYLDRVGRPDEKAIAAEQRGNDFMDG